MLLKEEIVVKYCGMIADQYPYQRVCWQSRLQQQILYSHHHHQLVQALIGVPHKTAPRSPNGIGSLTGAFLHCVSALSSSCSRSFPTVAGSARYICIYIYMAFLLPLQLAISELNLNCSNRQCNGIGKFDKIGLQDLNVN